VAAALGYIDFRVPHLLSDERYPQLMAWQAEFSQRASMLATMPSN
jgi:hypothetical protein